MIVEDVNRKPPLFIKIIGFILLFGLGFFIKSHFSNARKMNDKAIIQQKLDSINKTLPILIDDLVRADTVFMLDDGGFKYCFTLDVDDKVPTAFIEAFKHKLKTTGQENYDNNPGMKSFREMDAKIINYYNDKNGYYLFDFTLRPTKK